jgi:alanyl-tRNA synthetase
MTEKRYYQDIHQTEFQAQVIAATEEKKYWKVLLDQTYFYPEGGGQPADKGWINNIPVMDVQKDGESVFHYLEENPGTGTISAKIDTTWRNDFMQQHTGQHIISGALWQVGEYKTVSVHMGLEYTTIEIAAGEISYQDLYESEDLANQIIADDLPVTPVNTTDKELGQFPLRKPVARVGDIRLVSIGQFDCVACGGIHMERTGKVQLVKAVGVEKIRGNTRITWKIGKRALSDYRQKDLIIANLKPLLATKEEHFPDKTGELIAELLATKKEISQMENRLAELVAQQLLQNQQDLPGKGITLITHCWQDEKDQLIKKVMKHVLKEPKILVCLVNKVSGKLRWSIGCSEDIDVSFDKIKSELLPIIGGKGGGRFPLWQGSGSKPEAIDTFFATLRHINKK